MSFGKVGGYFATKAGQSWLNPRVIVTGQVLGGSAKIVLDEYEPITSGAKRTVSLSDGYVLYPIGKSLSIGPDLNGSWTEGGAHWLKGAVVLTAKVASTESVFLRLNCIGRGTPSSIRAEWSHKF
jgi:hypothetical protein